MDDPLLQAAQAQIGAPTNPLDEITSLTSSFTPEESADFLDQVPAMAAMKADDAKGKGARAQFYEAIRNSSDSLSNKRADLIKKMASDSPLSKSETAAMLFIGLLPTLVGKAVGGNRGGQIGAQAGALGATTMTAGIKADANKRDVRNQLEVNAIDKQLEKNEAVTARAKLDEFNAEDTAIQKNADRQQSAINAETRANGEVSAAKETATALSNQTKELRNAALESKQNARAKPIRVGTKIYAPTDSVRDEDVKVLREGLDSYDTFQDSIKKMIAIAKSSDAAFFTNQWTNSSQLKDLREQAESELANINTIPGRGGEFLTNKYEAMLKDPTTFYTNVMSRVKDPSIPDQLQHMGEMIERKLDRKLQRKGFNPPIDIGRPKQDPASGKVGYFVGYNPDGTAHYTFDEQEMLDIKERGF